MSEHFRGMVHSVQSYRTEMVNQLIHNNEQRARKIARNTLDRQQQQQQQKTLKMSNSSFHCRDAVDSAIFAQTNSEYVRFEWSHNDNIQLINNHVRR